MAKTIISFELEDSDNPSDYANPIEVLCIVKEISDYLRSLEKYGTCLDTVPGVVHEIRQHVLNLCESIPLDWK